MATYQQMNDGNKMPSVGLGTYTAFDHDGTEQSINTALEIGYRYLDTAYNYQNEAIIGKVLQKWFSSGKLKREDIFITTKLPMAGMHPDRVEKFLKESLTDLQLDYVDLYLIHWPVDVNIHAENNTGEQKKPAKVDHCAIWKKMEEQVAAGRVKSIGLSNFNAQQIENIWQSATIKPSNLQIELSPIFQQRDLVEYCQKKGIVVTAFSSLGSQTIVNQWTKSGLLKEAFPKVLENEVILKIAKKHQKTAAQIIIRYFVQQNVVQIPKSSNPERLKSNLDVFNFKLDEEDNKDILSLDMGEAGRLVDPGKQKEEFRNHPDYPFRKT